MSDRDDIDVVDGAVKNTGSMSEEKVSDDNSSNKKFNQAIRQNPLAHSDDKSVGKGIFGKLKRVFSSSGDLVKESKPAADNAKNNIKEITDDKNIKDNTITPNNKEVAFDPEEEEEFRMMSAILNGEHYIPPQTEKQPDNAEDEKAADKEPEKAEDEKTTDKEPDNAEDEKTTDKEPDNAEDEKAADKEPEKAEDEKTTDKEPDSIEDEKTTDKEPDNAEDEKTTDKEPDSIEDEKTTDKEPDNAEDEKNTDKEPDRAEDEKTTDKEPENAEEVKSTESKPEDVLKSESTNEIKENIKNQESVYDVQNAFDNEEAEFVMIDIDDDADFVDDIDLDDEDFEDKSEELKPEEKTEDKSEELKSEEKAEDKSQELKSEEKTEDKSQELKPEEKTEDKSQELKPEEKTEDKSEELKSEEKTEDKSEELKPEEKTEDKSEELKPEEKTEDKSEELKPEEKTEDKSEELKSEEKTEDKSEELKPEEKAEDKSEELKSEEKTEDKSQELKPEEKTEDKSEELKSEEKAEEIKPEADKHFDNIKVENINSEGNKIGDDDEDEEIHFEEEFVFDESDDDVIDAVTPIDDNETIDNLGNLFDTSENVEQPVIENVSQESKNDTPDVPAEMKNSESTEKQNPEETASNAQSPEEKNPENLAQNSVKAQESQPDKNGDVNKQEEPLVIRHKEYEDISSNLTDEEKQKKAGKLKTTFAKVKDKLVRMWNTKDDGTVEGEKTSKAEQHKSNKTFVSDKADVAASAADTDVKADIIAITPENSKSISEGENKPDNAEISVSENISSENEQSAKIIPMTVIKNENANVVPIDKDKVRESLSVIQLDKKPAEPDILTDEQKHQLEMNQKVLEKVKQYEEETAEKREELRKARAERSAKAYEKAFGTVDPIKELEVNDYLSGEPVNIIKVKAGKFSESVRSEYEFYVGYTRLKNVAKQQTKVESTAYSEESQPAAAAQPKSTPAAERVSLDESRYAEFSDDRFAKSRDKLDSISKRLDYKDTKNPETVEYRTEDDAVKIKKLLQDNLKNAKLQWSVSLGLTIAMFVLFCIGGVFTVGAGENAKDSSLRGFAFINLCVYGAMLYNCREIIFRGLQPLRKLKSNSDTGYAAAAVVAAFQSIVVLINPTPFFRQGMNVYTLIVTLALAVSSLGKQRNADRISSNFRFVSDSSQKYTGKFFHDQRMVATLLSGTRNDKSELVFQKKTAFLKHFMKLSTSPDPGESLGDKFSLPTIIFSLVISIVYLCLSKSFADSISVLSIMLCAAVPMCSKALGSVPLHKLAKNSLANQSMVVGYQAVECFSESAAVMLDAKELYPEGSVHMNGIKKFDSKRIDDAMLAAASVIITAGGAMAGMFDGIIQGNKLENLPPAENVIYEDGKGLIGWVNNERIFIGNRELLREHDIEPMPKEYEAEQKENGDEILYLACAGELVAMFIVGYSANRRVADALRRMEANGMSMLIRTTDVNITAERIAKDFGVSHRSIKILEQKNSNVVRDEMIGKEKSSPAFVATKGGVTSFGRAVSGCIQTKRNISLSLAVQIVGVLLGLLIVTVIALVSGVHHIGAIPMFFFFLFWVAAVLGAPMIAQKIQKY